MTSHTPGPWYAVTPDGASWSVAARHGEAGWFIAQVLPNAPATATGRTNAQLIAEAPTMFAILQSISRYAEADPERYVAFVDGLVTDFLCRHEAEQCED